MNKTMTTTAANPAPLLAKLAELRARREAHENSKCDVCGLHADIHRPGCPDAPMSPEEIAYQEKSFVDSCADNSEDYPGQRITGPADA